MNFFHKFKYFDIPLQIATLLLLVVGLALLYSTSLSGETTATFWRQVAFAAAGVPLYLFFSFFDYHQLSKVNRMVYVVSVILLIYLLVAGPDIRGGRRWLPLGFASIQLAEFVKIVVIVSLARLLYLRRGQINSWRNVIQSFLVAFIPAALVLVEPDFGSALVIVCVWAGVILVSPIKKQFLITLFLVAVATGGIGWKFFLKDFQKDRIAVFLNPELDPRGRGYNVRQATIAVGSGKLTGRGLGQGLQSQHKFLPERQNDFIFSASSEEIGFLGSMSLAALYYFILYRLLMLVQRSRDDLGMYIAAGMFFLLLTHVIINIGMNIGLMPVTGIPLPFMSSGGSSLMALMVGFGIVQNVAMQSKILRF